MIIQVFSAFWAVAMFSILTETPKKFLPYAAFSGGFAWWAYLIINNLTHSTLQAAFFSILAVAFLSHILARIKKAPVTVFLIAGILPSVPAIQVHVIREKVFRLDRFAVDIFDRIAENMIIRFRKIF